MMPLPIGDCRLPIGKTENDLKILGPCGEALRIAK